MSSFEKLDWQKKKINTAILKVSKQGVKFAISSTSYLQLVQNVAVQMLSGQSKFYHVTPILHVLHWFPVIFQTQFKRLVIPYKALYSLGPGYLKDRLILQNYSWPLRSTGVGLLRVPPLTEVKLEGAREKYFSVAASALLV